jgi:hypothetical protein
VSVFNAESKFGSVDDYKKYRRHNQTSWLVQHKIRKAVADRDCGYTLGGIVEVDEGYVGGGEEGRSADAAAKTRRWLPSP